jgi:hypothetical protein
MFLKLLAGKLNEAHQVIQSTYFGSALAKTYDARLSADGRDALVKLKRYFSKKNNVHNIRKNYAFHYSPDELTQVLPSISNELVIYMQHKGPANNLFFFAEVVAAEALFRTLGVPSSLSALDDLVVCWINNARNSLPSLAERDRVGHLPLIGDDICVVESRKNSS